MLHCITFMGSSAFTAEDFCSEVNILFALLSNVLTAI